MKTLQKTLQGAAILAAVVVSAGAARADLTLQGAVGLPLNPTAQIPEQDGVRVQANYADLGDITPTNRKARVYGLYAAGRVGENLEINGGIEKLDGPTDLFGPGDGNYNKTGFALGAKYLFTRESDPAKVRIAAGIGYSQAQVRNLYGYVVATKYLGEFSGERVPITAHLGLRYDRFDYKDIFDVGAQTSSKASIYGGVEVPVTRKGEFTLVGELQSKNLKSNIGSIKAPYEFSVRYRPQNQGFSASVGVARRSVFGNKSGVFAQLGYSFSTGEGRDESEAQSRTAPGMTGVPSNVQ